MSDENQQAGKYIVHHAVQSAIGDYAKVNNYISPQEAAEDDSMAELRRLFAEVNKRLAALEEDDRKLVALAVEQTVQATTEMQKGDSSEAKQRFLEKRLKHIHDMAPDIGAVIIATLASPAAGIAMVIQKIAQKVQAELGVPAEPAEGTAAAGGSEAAAAPPEDAAPKPRGRAR